MSNICSPELRQIWDARRANGGADADVVQERVTALRNVMKCYPPNPSVYKALVARLHGFPRWPVRPPLVPLTDEKVDQAIREAELAAPLAG